MKGKIMGMMLVALMILGGLLLIGDEGYQSAAEGAVFKEITRSAGDFDNWAIFGDTISDTNTSDAIPSGDTVDSEGNNLFMMTDYTPPPDLRAEEIKARHEKDIDKGMV